MLVDLYHASTELFFFDQLTFPHAFHQGGVTHMRGQEYVKNLSASKLKLKLKIQIKTPKRIATIRQKRNIHNEIHNLPLSSKDMICNPSAHLSKNNEIGNGMVIVSSVDVVSEVQYSQMHIHDITNIFMVGFSKI